MICCRLGLLGRRRGRQVTAGERSVFTQFNALPDLAGFAPELAAYRLDRMLGLCMVPVTVRRQYRGREHTLQYVTAATFGERARLVDDETLRANLTDVLDRGRMDALSARREALIGASRR